MVVTPFLSVPALVNISFTFILDGFECLDTGLLMWVPLPHDAAIFHGWSNQTLVNFTSDNRCGSTREITMKHVEHSDTLRYNPFPVQAIITGVARNCVGGGGTRRTPPSLASLVHTFEAVAGSWRSVSAPAVSRVMSGAPERKKIVKNR